MSEEVSSIDLKNYIIQAGLYEAGMSFSDMQSLYVTLKRSKQSISEENEYHSIMTQTEINCSNIKVLKSEKKKMQILKEIKSNVDVSKENDIRQSDKADQTNLNQNYNDKPDVIQESRNNHLPIFYHHKNFLKLPMKKRIDAITCFLEYQLIQTNNVHTKNSIDWCKPIIPTRGVKFDSDSKVIVETESSSTINKQIEEKEDSSKDKNDSNSNELLENTNIQNEKNENCTQNKSTNNSQNIHEPTFSMRKSKRLVKRKNYVETASDDDELSNQDSIKKTKLELNETKATKIFDSDDDFCTTSKKSKLNNTSSPTYTKKTNETQLKNKLSKYEDKFLVSQQSREVNDRTNKTFDNLKKMETTKKPQQTAISMEENEDELLNIEDIFPQSKKKEGTNVDKNMASDSSDCSEQICPETQTVVDIHNECTPEKLKDKNLPQKPQPRSRKKLTYSKTINKTKQNSNLTNITTSTFYGNDKVAEDVSNNNKSTLKMTQCPICSRSYPTTEIEAHASRCEQYTESQKELCNICNKYFASTEMQEHRSKCLKEIFENSDPVTDNLKKNKNVSNVMFLCSICDKYVSNSNKEEHNNSCIGTINET